MRNNFKLLLALTLLFTGVTQAQVGIGTTTPNASSALDVTSTNKGFLLPRLTYVQKIAVNSPVAGLQIWCSDCSTSGELQVFNGTTWTNSVGAVASFAKPGAPTSPIATASNAQASVAFTAPSSTGGSAITGYTVTSSPGSFTTTGSASPLIVTGLTNGTSYTFTVVANNAVGSSVASSASSAVTPTFVCGASLTFIYNGSSVTVGTVSRDYGGTVGIKCWLDRNLGATQVATSSTDSASYGHYFQWGRGADGHQLTTSTSTATLSTTDVPSHANFIITSTPSGDWRSPQNNNLWNGVNGTNNPCPSGFRLPTEIELNTERLTWSPSNVYGAYASPLKFSAAGRRYENNGNLGETGTNGYYYSSNVSNTDALRLDSNTSTNGSSIQPDHRAIACSVRCIMN